MGLRFRRSVRIAPGLRLNASKSGLGLSLGVRGAGISFGPRGTWVHAGLPGTGLSVRERVGDSRATRSRSGVSASSIEVSVHVDENTGEVSYLDTEGEPLPAQLLRAAKRQAKDFLPEVLEKHACEINEKLKWLERLHLETPNPQHVIEFTARPYEYEKPTPFAYEAIGFLGKVFGFVRRRREARNAERRRQYDEELAKWSHGRATHESSERSRRANFDAVMRGEPSAMEEALNDRLATLAWPYETTVAYELSDAKSLTIDVDLPELEDLPVREASVAARGNKLNLKTLTDKRRRQLYLSHVHAIGFRLLGECFATLPTLRRVTISAYSQRIDPSSGHDKDDYLYSARVKREDLSAFNFDNLAALDPVAAFERFELRRKVTKTGIISAVQPFPSERFM